MIGQTPEPGQALVRTIAQRISYPSPGQPTAVKASVKWIIAASLFAVFYFAIYGRKAKA